MNDQREALRRLADAAGRAALEEGTKPGLALQRRVQNTVRAAALSEPDALREGALEHELQPSGFDTLAGAPPARQRSSAKEHQQAAARARERADEARRAAGEAAARALELRRRR